MSELQSSILITDLDGTLIPIDSGAGQCNALLELNRQLTEKRTPLVFATGRHLQSVEVAIKDFDLPIPMFLIADVGTSIYAYQSGHFVNLDAYAELLSSIVGKINTSRLAELFKGIEGLTLQEVEKQGQFKLSYYVDKNRINSLVGIIKNQINALDAPYQIVDSVDPFNGDGLIDLLPRNISKAAAIKWIQEFNGWRTNDIVYAGDSRNDLAAMTAGYKTIVVQNAPDSLRDVVHRIHNEKGWVDRLFFANEVATGGVLQGCNWFNLFK